jgi:hypothetical protein
VLRCCRGAETLTPGAGRESLRHCCIPLGDGSGALRWQTSEEELGASAGRSFARTRSSRGSARGEVVALRTDLGGSELSAARSGRELVGALAGFAHDADARNSDV